jgi:uncharacterized protein YbcI
MENNIKRTLPPVIGRIFRELSGKGPERQYVFMAGNVIAVRVYGYVQGAFYDGKLLEDGMMCSAMRTYYQKMLRNSIDVIRGALQVSSDYNVMDMLCDFHIKNNNGVIFLVLDRYVEDDNAIHGAELQFIQHHVRTFFKKHTGGIPKLVNAYFCDNCLLICAEQFLGSFTETPFMNDAEMIEANKIFYLKMIQHAMETHIGDYSTDKVTYTDVFCDVNIYSDSCYIFLKGEPAQ